MKYPILITLTFIASFQSCILAQKTKEIAPKKNYNGSVISKNMIEPPTYKFSSPNSFENKINRLNLYKNDFQQELSNFLIQLINDTLSLQPGITSKLNLIKLTNISQSIKAFQKKEYYEIDFNAGIITISAISVEGIINGLASLEYELTQSTNPKLKIKDWPSIEKRIMQVTLKSMDPEIVKQILFRLWRGHFNGALYSIHNSVEFNTTKKYCLKDAMSKDGFKSICEFGKLFNIEAIPHFAFLSHQNKAFVQEAVSPKLLYNSQTLDPRNPDVYKLIFSQIDEVIELINPKIIHIGHDEVTGHTPKQIERFGQILPPNLFLYNVNKINQYLLSKNIEVWMWGDMLIYPDDFPEMHPGSFNAPLSYKWLIDSIPKNIIICDWHYKHYKGKLKKKLDFSSIDFFLNKGFNVLGATYNVSEMTNQFSNYIIEKSEPNFNGMIATSWHKLLKGTTRSIKNNDKLEEFDSILGKSSNAYWNAK